MLGDKLSRIELTPNAASIWLLTCESHDEAQSTANTLIQSSAKMTVRLVRGHCRGLSESLSLSQPTMISLVPAALLRRLLVLTLLVNFPRFSWSKTLSLSVA